jgi:hypothetical protein
MGNESNPQRVDLNSVKALAAVVRDALAVMDKTIDTAEKLGLTDFSVRQVPKGRKAVQGLLEFSTLLNVSVVGSLLPKPIEPEVGAMIAAEPIKPYDSTTGNKPRKKPES